MVLTTQIFTKKKNAQSRKYVRERRSPPCRINIIMLFCDENGAKHPDYCYSQIKPFLFALVSFKINVSSSYKPESTWKFSLNSKLCVSQKGRKENVSEVLKDLRFKMPRYQKQGNCWLGFASLVLNKTPLKPEALRFIHRVQRLSRRMQKNKLLFYFFMKPVENNDEVDKRRHKSVWGKWRRKYFFVFLLVSRLETLVFSASE